MSWKAQLGALRPESLHCMTCKAQNLETSAQGSKGPNDMNWEGARASDPTPTCFGVQPATPEIDFSVSKAGARREVTVSSPGRE